MSLSFHHLFLLTYNIHHSRGTTTDSLAGVIGWAGVGPSITRDQKRSASRIPTITVIVTTRHKAAATCWSPAVSYLTSCTQSSASQGDSWCCSVVWRLVAFLKWSVADVNHNLEGWRKLATGCESLSLLQTCHPRMNCFSTYIGCVNWTPHYSFEHQDAHMRLMLQVYLGLNTLEFSAICR